MTKFTMLLDTVEMKFYNQTCCMCGIDLCINCVEHEDYVGDYPDRYCKDCWTVIGEKYRSKINELENEIEKLHSEWRKECVNKTKK